MCTIHSPEPRRSTLISCAGSNGDLMPFCDSSKRFGESAHLHRLTVAFVIIKVFFEKVEKMHFITHGMFYHIPVFVVPA